MSYLMKSARTVCFTALWLGAIHAGDLAVEDRHKGEGYLIRTRDGVLAATRGLSDAQWDFKPGQDRWSAAEIVEHLALAEEALLANVTEDVMKRPAVEVRNGQRERDALVLALVPDRSQRARAVQPLIPSGRWTPRQALARFVENRERTLGYLRAAGGLREHVMDSPLGEPLDAFQWLLLIGGHTERHLQQLREVTSHAGFPRR